VNTAVGNFIKQTETSRGMYTFIYDLIEANVREGVIYSMTTYQQELKPERLQGEKKDQTRLKQSIDIIFPMFRNALSLTSSSPLENTRVEITFYFKFIS
jgi:hypothetical protein